MSDFGEMNLTLKVVNYSKDDWLDKLDGKTIECWVKYPVTLGEVLFGNRIYSYRYLYKLLSIRVPFWTMRLFKRIKYGHIKPGEWTHVSFVYNEDAPKRIWVNGKEVGASGE